MDLNKLEKDINDIVGHLNKDNCIYELLLAYDFPKATITRLKKGSLNKSKNKDNANQEILWKSLFFKMEQQQDLHLAINEAQTDNAVLKQQPRFIIVTNFTTLLAVDTKIGDSLDIPLTELGNNHTFFLPWAGMEKTQIQSLNLPDIKAAEKLAQLYDIIIQENHIETESERHGLNIFLSRLLFCFFAEDTGIFEDNQFTNAVASHTSKDGNDCQNYLVALFKVLNVEKRSDEPTHLKAFPYVNGGLFATDYPAPKLNAKARKMIVDSGALNWKQINPDIFGSMMQAVVHSEQRGSLGMHYTSVANIRKVIEPLFLNDLKEQLKKAEGNENKLTKLIDRIYHLRLFDPACGSGNFLIIAYKELCKLELEILKQLQQVKLYSPDSIVPISLIRLTQFYGIELDDFAHETAKLSLWLAEHQMNLAFKGVFGTAKPTLPLQEGGHIVCGNATRLDWEVVCPKEDGSEVYIMGNPPYLGDKLQSLEQKNDLKLVFEGIKNAKAIDYVGAWFLMASRYITKQSQFAFVSTNSICQGVQVPLLWPNIFKSNLEIYFAHTSFNWSNNAKDKAKVICVIIGVRSVNKSNKYLFDGITRKQVSNINAYLIDAKNIIVAKKNAPFSNLPFMVNGNIPRDKGNLMLSENDKISLEQAYPSTIQCIKRIVGSKEFLNDIKRWCLWIEDEQIKQVEIIPEIRERLQKIKTYRENGSERGKLGIYTPYKFERTLRGNDSQLIIPRVSSGRREYLPIGFLERDYIVSDAALVIFDPEPHIFGIISSKMHMAWIKAIAGRLKSDYRYSIGICYNTFPFPEISEVQKTTLEDHVFNVLDEREKHPEKTMAEIYDPDKMPESLRQAHHEMDVAVEQCYRKHPFKGDEERLEYLFRLYEEMIEAEKGKE